MGSDLIVRQLNDSDYDAWRRFVAAAPSGSIYALPEYLSVLCDVTAAQFKILGVFKGTELLGGMPLYEARSKVGTVAANRLLLYYHSPVIRDYATQYPSERTSRQLGILQALVKVLDEQSYAHLLLHVRHPINDVRPFQLQGWRVKPNYSYVVQIGDLTSAWGKIEQNLRRLIDRADKNGLTVSQDDDFDSFFRLHQDTHHRKGAPLYLQKSPFERYYRTLREKNLATLFNARSAIGKVVATQLVLLGPHPICHTVCAAADAEFLSMGSTPFLRWKAFETLSQLGYKGNDLTDAALNDVTRFKSQLGGDLVTNWVIVKPESVKYRLYQKLAIGANKIRSLRARGD